MRKDLSLLIVVPAYNSVNTLPMVISELEAKYKKYVLVVDDGSNDETFSVAKDLGLEVIRHSVNKGCGAAQKTGFQRAIDQKVDAVVILHADDQYDPAVIPELTDVFVNEGCDIVLASRMLNPQWAFKDIIPPLDKKRIQFSAFVPSDLALSTLRTLCGTACNTRTICCAGVWSKPNNWAFKISSEGNLANSKISSAVNRLLSSTPPFNSIFSCSL